MCYENHVLRDGNFVSREGGNLFLSSTVYISYSNQLESELLTYIPDDENDSTARIIYTFICTLC